MCWSTENSAKPVWGGIKLVRVRAGKFLMRSKEKEYHQHFLFVRSLSQARTGTSAMAKKSRRKLHNCTCAICQRHPYSQIAKEHKAINRVLLGLDERNRRRFIGMLASQ